MHYFLMFWVCDFEILIKIDQNLINFERRNRRYSALNSLAALACLIFRFTHHGPPVANFRRKRHEALVFDGIGHRRPMMSESKNQACEFLSAPPNYSDFLTFLSVFKRVMLMKV